MVFETVTYTLAGIGIVLGLIAILALVRLRDAERDNDEQYQELKAARRDRDAYAKVYYEFIRNTRIPVAKRKKAEVARARE